MKAFVENKPEKVLTNEERNLLSVAYKNVVGVHRASWRAITAIIDRDKDKCSSEVAVEYKQKIKDDLSSVCEEVLVSTLHTDRSIRKCST